VMICAHNNPNGIGDHPTDNGGDVPPDAGPCWIGTCHQLEPEQQPRVAGHPCPNGTCNGQGNCV
jgi:hypothetical protein